GTFGGRGSRDERTSTVWTAAVGRRGMRGPGIRLDERAILIVQTRFVGRAEPESELRFFNHEVAAGRNCAAGGKFIDRVCRIVVRTGGATVSLEPQDVDTDARQIAPAAKATASRGIERDIIRAGWTTAVTQSSHCGNEAVRRRAGLPLAELDRDVLQ